MTTAGTVQQIAKNQAEHFINTGVVRAVRGQYLDIVLDGTGKQIREVLLSNTITGIDVGWWVVVIRLPRTNRWVAISALETLGQGTTVALIGQPTPANAVATGKPYLIGFFWSGSFKDTATYEVQHNSSASATGATTIKVEGSNYLYWCAPGTTRYFRVRAVASNFERSSWSDWVNATADAGEAYMTMGVNAGATDVEWQAFDWDLVAAVTAADMVHSHESDAEGGQLDWDTSFADAVHTHDGTAAEGGDIFPRWISVNATGVPDQEGATALGSVAADPSVIGGAGIIYTKDFSGIPELCYIDDAGNVVQITSGGSLPGASDHGELTGLADDDDHPQYLLADGTRALAGAVTLSGPSMTVPDGWWLGIGAGTERIVIDDAGYISVMGANFGAGMQTPQGRLHGWGAGGVGRCIFWDYDNLAGGLVTIVPDGAGDVTRYCYALGLICEITGAGFNTINDVLTPNASIAIYNDGVDVVTLACTAAGALTVQRTAGADTFKIVLWIVWI